MSRAWDALVAITGGDALVAITGGVLILDGLGAGWQSNAGVGLLVGWFVARQS